MPDPRHESKGASAGTAQPTEHHEPDQVTSADAPPAEVVEAVLLKHPHVRDAAAVVLPHDALGSTVGVLLVLDDDVLVGRDLVAARRLREVVLVAGVGTVELRAESAAAVLGQPVEP